MRRVPAHSSEIFPARLPSPAHRSERFLPEDLTTAEAVVVLEAIARHLEGRLDKVKTPHQSHRLSSIAESLRARVRQISNTTS